MVNGCYIVYGVKVTPKFVASLVTSGFVELDLFIDFYDKIPREELKFDTTKIDSLHDKAKICKSHLTKDEICKYIKKMCELIIRIKDDTFSELCELIEYNNYSCISSPHKFMLYNNKKAAKKFLGEDCVTNNGEVVDTIVFFGIIKSVNFGIGNHDTTITINDMKKIGDFMSEIKYDGEIFQICFPNDCACCS